MNGLERWAAEQLPRVPAGPPVSELRQRVRARRMRRTGATLAVLAVVSLVTIAGLVRSPSERGVRVISPAPTVSTSSTSSTTSTTAPRPGESPLTTRWRALDVSEDIWSAALAAIRSSGTPAAAAESVLPILRAGRELPSEKITARVIDEGSDESVIWIEWRGFGDDSVAGRDLRIRVATVASKVVVRTAEIRTVCRRGVGGDSCL